MNEKIKEAQRYLQEMKADGWLLYDFHRQNQLAHLFLEIPPSGVVTRRFFYFIPARGEPIRIVHAIEAHILDAWPGEKRIYSSWQSLQEQLKNALQGKKRVAMEYSPMCAIPYVSKVDGGTIDLVRSFGVEVMSSASFLPHFTAVITEEQGKSHIRAGQALSRIVEEAQRWIGQQLRQKRSITEYDVQQKIMFDFAQAKLITDDPPIVAVNEHSADPHYEPSKEKSTQIERGDFVLIDLWAKESTPGAIYGDITRVAVADDKPTAKQRDIFSIVRKAQLAATDLVRMRFKQKQPIQGWEVDDAARNIIKAAGYGDKFIHRTGHNIEISLHGSGANMDNLEMHDVRPILLSTCFSIEPGIYLSGEFGVRLEYDLYVHKDGTVEVVGGEQDEIAVLLS